jgi:hypothetical protein
VIFDRSSKTTKKYTFCVGLLAFFLTLLVTPKLNAQKIAMSGSLGYERFGNFVTLSASRIDNFRVSGSISGTLSLQLWATYTPYYGGTLSGYKLAEINLGQLWGGNYFGNIRQMVSLFEPPTGYYNMILILGEWNGYEYLVEDWFNFANLQNFVGVPPYTPPLVQEPLDLIDEPIFAPNPPASGVAAVSPGSGEQVQSPKKGKKAPAKKSPAKAKKSGSKKKPAAKKVKKR